MTTSLGFHKRKKKRRKEAQKHQGQALRRKRNEEERKNRKLERELVNGVVPPATEIDENQVEPVAGTKTYENAALKVTVVTSEISPEEEEAKAKK